MREVGRNPGTWYINHTRSRGADASTAMAVTHSPASLAMMTGLYVGLYDLLTYVEAAEDIDTDPVRDINDEEPHLLPVVLLRLHPTRPPHTGCTAAPTIRLKRAATDHGSVGEGSV